jgi:hypothetical protein
MRLENLALRPPDARVIQKGIVVVATSQLTFKGAEQLLKSRFADVIPRGTLAYVRRKSLAPDETGCHASCHDALENVAQDTALAEAAKPIHRERRMVRN